MLSISSKKAIHFVIISSIFFRLIETRPPLSMEYSEPVRLMELPKYQPVPMISNHIAQPEVTRKDAPVENYKPTDMRATEEGGEDGRESGEQMQADESKTGAESQNPTESTKQDGSENQAKPSNDMESTSVKQEDSTKQAKPLKTEDGKEDTGDDSGGEEKVREKGEEKEPKPKKTEEEHEAEMNERNAKHDRLFQKTPTLQKLTEDGRMYTEEFAKHTKSVLATYLAFMKSPYKYKRLGRQKDAKLLLETGRILLFVHCLGKKD